MAEITGNPEQLSQAADQLAGHGCGAHQSRLAAHGARGAAAAGHPAVAAACAGFTSTVTDTVSRFGQVMDTSTESFRVAGGAYRELSRDIVAQSGDGGS